MVNSEINNSEVEELYQTVIKGGYCIGCGACTSIKDSPFKIKMNELGNYIAEIDDKQNLNQDIRLLNICPFSGESKNEDELGEIFFPENNKDMHIGKYLECFSGYVTEGNFRSHGSSGGFGKWLGYQLLRDNEIDFFIQVIANTTNKAGVALFDYQVFSNPEEVIKGSKSAYYPTTLVDVIEKIKEIDGRYAITGTPCFVKALRLLSLENTLLIERIRFTIGIVCGGMKSANQSKMIGWQLGVHPDNLVAIDFRRKYKDRPASEKIYQVWSNSDKKERFENARKIIGTDYGAGYFKPNACDYCDDVVAETADISIGDAWLPQYVTDAKGTSIIVVRNRILLELLKKYRNQQKLYLEQIDKADVIKSQESGFRHRREALSYRLAKKKGQNQWAPKKRIISNQFKITKKRKKIYSLREKLAQRSHIYFLEALQKNSLSVFIQKIEPLMDEYKKENRVSIFRRGMRKMKKILKK